MRLVLLSETFLFTQKIQKNEKIKPFTYNNGKVYKHVHSQLLLT
jgi:hypothetical protein